MATETVQQILVHVRGLHDRLNAFYEARLEDSQRPRVKLLLEYLKSREHELAQRLGEFEAQAGEGLLNTWYAFTPEDGIQERLEGVSTSEEMSLDQVLALALKLDECIVSVYRKLAEKAPSVETRELFESLAAGGTSEEHQLARIAEDIARFM